MIIASILNSNYYKRKEISINLYFSDLYYFSRQFYFLCQLLLLPNVAVFFLNCCFSVYSLYANPFMPSFTPFYYQFCLSRWLLCSTISIHHHLTTSLTHLIIIHLHQPILSTFPPKKPQNNNTIKY